MKLLFSLSCLCWSLLFFSLNAQGDVCDHLPERPFLDIQFDKDLFTVKACDVELMKILEALSRKTGVPIIQHGSLQDRISVRIVDRPLEGVLSRLVPSWALETRGEGRSRRIVKATVFSKGSGPLFSSGLDAHAKNTLESESASQLLSQRTGPELKSEEQQSESVAPVSKNAEDSSRYAPQELVVRFQPDISRAKREELLHILGATLKQEIPALNTVVLALPETLDVEQALEIVAVREELEFSEPNRIIPLQQIPNDPYFDQQWALHNSGEGSGLVSADISAPEAWDLETGHKDVVVAVIDTGVDYGHEDLAANIWHNPAEIPENGLDDDENGFVDDVLGWDFVEASGGAAGEDVLVRDNDPMDVQGHGTHVAGIVGAVTNNGIGMAGTAPNCRIMPVRSGYMIPSGGGVLESADAAEAILYAAENGADVLNLSWGEYAQSNLIRDALDHAADKGLLICAAAGNGNTDQQLFPAGFDNPAIMAVGALAEDDQRASFSNYGSWVDLYAPGVSILSTSAGGGYTRMSGTSMAAPFAAGAAAILFSHFPDSSSVGVKTRLQRAADLLPGMQAGRLNMFEALTVDITMPFIESISPNEVHQNEQLKLFGDSFGSEQGSSRILFASGAEAQVVSWSKNQITCLIPLDAHSGPLQIETLQGMSNSVQVDVLPKYYEETPLSGQFEGRGQARNWQADDRSWVYQLPFPFTFFGETYSRVHVCSNGFLDFSDGSAAYVNGLETLKERVMIAPLWDDLLIESEAGHEEDIFIDASDPDVVRFCWKAQLYDNGQAVAFEALLFKDGRIRFHYGPGNRDLTPTIGISGGGGERYALSRYNNASRLDGQQSLQFVPFEQSFSITLDSGWNLVSFPVELSDQQMIQTFGDATGAIESIWTYQDGNWQTFSLHHSGPNTLQCVKPGLGYWIKSSEPGLTIEARGVFSGRDPTLIPGWNLIGWNILGQKTVSELRHENSRSILSIWRYQKGSWSLYHSKHSEMSDLSHIVQGEGYWVLVE